MFAHKLVDRLAQCNPAEAIALGEHFLGIEPFSEPQGAIANCAFELARELPVQRLRTVAVQPHARLVSSSAHGHPSLLLQIV